MRKPALILTAIVLGLVALVLLATQFWNGDPSPSPATPGTGNSPADQPPKSARDPRPQGDESFEALCARLATAPDPKSARQALADLRSSLADLGPERAAEAVRDYLATGEDEELELPYKLGENGQLETAPTIRTALLDHLAVVNPSAAAALSREILSSPTTADEWSLALRNVARSGEERDYLLGKTEELITNPEWQANPSVGYLNSFDVFVHAEAVEKTPLLSDLVQRKDRRDLAHASFLTIDRLTLRSPQQMLQALSGDAALHQSRPEMVAQQFARADFRDQQQQAVVRQWLLDDQRTATELNTFARTFPNGNMMVSNNLLSSQAQFNGTDLRDRDLRSLETVETWLRTPEFEPIRDHLVTMQRRLTTFVDQAREE